MLVIKNATLPSGDVVWLCIVGGKIRNFGMPNHAYVGEFIDASGLVAIPGIINCHVHLRDPGHTHKEDNGTGSRAAIWGGTTTIYIQPNTDPPFTAIEQADDRIAAMETNFIEERFWFGATPENAGEIKWIPKIPRVGGVKLSMGSTTGNLLVDKEEDQRKHLAAAAEHKVIVAVHAENEALMRKYFAEIKEREGKVRIADHCRVRDTEVEVSAVRIALRLQRETGAFLYFCHVSTPEALELIQDAKQAGAVVWAEVCPHHWTFSEERLQGPRGGFYKMNPPLRTPVQVQRLRHYVCTPGWVDTVASDHAPHTLLEKETDDYAKVPSGVPGVQDLFYVTYDLVAQNAMTLQHFIALTSGNAARIFGLKNKGRIEVGADADLVLFDPKAPFTIRNEDQKSKCGWTPYHGMATTGVIRYVVAGGVLHKIN